MVIHSTLRGSYLNLTLLMIFMTNFSNFVFKESKQASLKDHIYIEVVVSIFLGCALPREMAN